MNADIDTAALVKAFVLEPDSAEIIRLLEEIGEPFLYSHLHALEMPNAIRLKRLRGELTAYQETAAIRAFRADRFRHRPARRRRPPRSPLAAPHEMPPSQAFVLAHCLSQT